MQTSVSARTWALVTLAFLATACAGPYRPACQLEPVQHIWDGGGTLRVHGDGRVSLLEIVSRVELDAGTFSMSRLARVIWFSADGRPVDEFAVTLPPAPDISGGVMATSAVAFAEGVAATGPLAEGASTMAVVLALFVGQ